MFAIDMLLSRSRPALLVRTHIRSLEASERQIVHWLRQLNVKLQPPTLPGTWGFGSGASWFFFPTAFELVFLFSGSVAKQSLVAQKGNSFSSFLLAAAPNGKAKAKTASPAQTHAKPSP
jgi:hypothetical protein